MEKREKLQLFLDYGGNELFSSLMESDGDRPQALDRMCTLLQKALVFGKLNHRVAAYRYMIAKANELGFIKSNKLNAYKLTQAERERIINKVIQSTCAKSYFNKYGKNLIIYSTVLAAVVISILMINDYMHSEKYLKRMYGASTKTIFIEADYKTDDSIKLTIKNDSRSDYYICDLPTLEYVSEYGDRENYRNMPLKNAKLEDCFITEVNEYNEGEYVIPSGGSITLLLKSDYYSDDFVNAEYTVSVIVHPIITDKNSGLVSDSDVLIQDDFYFY